MNFRKPRGPQHTYYYIVVIIVAGKKMQEREMKYTFNEQKLPTEELHPVTDPLGENSRNPVKKQEKKMLRGSPTQKIIFYYSPERKTF